MTHSTQTWQNHQLQVGTFETEGRTWNFFSTNPRSVADAASGDQMPTTSGDRKHGIPDWLQPFTERCWRNNSENTSSTFQRNSFTQFLKDARCDKSKRTKKSRELHAEGILKVEKTRKPQATTFGDTITADHKVLREENESRLQHRYAVLVQELPLNGDKSCPCRTGTAQDTMRSLQRF